jgi:multidrug efflux pump subunit AcrA (membrane-fusion protein)
MNPQKQSHHGGLGGLSDSLLDRVDRRVALRPSPVWSRALIWSIIIFTLFCFVWMIFARLDEVVIAEGKLEPRGAIWELRAPVGGVVKLASVRDGEKVKAGQKLLRLDQRVTGSQMASFQEICDSLQAENDFYLKQISNSSGTITVDPNLPEEMQALARDRAALLAESRRLRAQLAHSAANLDLPPDQQELFDAAEANLAAKVAEASRSLEQSEGEMEGGRRQLEQVRLLLANNIKSLETYAELATKKVVSEQDRLRFEGQMLRTAMDVTKIEASIAVLEIEIRKLRSARENLELDYRKAALDSLEINRQRLAEIDTRMSRAVIDNKQRLAQTHAQMSQIDSSHGYQEVSAPVDGVVFDFRTKQPGDVVAAGDVLLKIVPGDALLANVSLSNKDIGFVKERMKASIRIHAFPFREFGEVSGHIALIGSDALPPTQSVPFHFFPARIELDSQSLIVRGRPVNLSSGMAITALVHVRDRRVIHLVLDLLFRPTEKLGELR